MLRTKAAGDCASEAPEKTTRLPRCTGLAWIIRDEAESGKMPYSLTYNVTEEV